ncbi:hypothetical protein FUA23_15160 [Neolewinella aurantiaca]|uniref:Tryptophan-rich sensory protein n=1 Tax=Neolewinella aurantiaca TaxID=2602767 RepID=A0A5C7FCD1_9BACT|nr:hypothetical protein [Neolewinella aurantiaca]TXF88317.1 hypothetical protein FUA23_15160 [Neolewinella aurantiaca]
MNQRSSQYLALASMLVMLALYALNATGNFGPNPIGTTSTATSPLIVPAPYAFAIWGPIYIGLVVFAVFQLVKNRNDHPAWVSFRYWYAANVVANGLWLAAASYDWQWLSVGIIIFMLISLFRINQLLQVIESSGAKITYWLEHFVFSIYFAWVTLATVLNVASALKFYKWNGFGVPEVTWTIIMIVVAAFVTGYTSRRYRDAAYAGVVVWAFVALSIKHWGAQTQVLSYVGGAVAVLFVGLIFWLLSGRSAGKNNGRVEAG